MHVDTDTNVEVSLETDTDGKIYATRWIWYHNFTEINEYFTQNQIECAMRRVLKVGFGHKVEFRESDTPDGKSFGLYIDGVSEGHWFRSERREWVA